MRKIINLIKNKIRNFIGVNDLRSIRNLIISHQTTERQKNHPNPLNSYGKKCFSQSDEDGITMEIIKRIGIKNGVYGEFGCGNGYENNTIVLAAAGWKGFWVGGIDLKFKHRNTKNFNFNKKWITKENAVELFSNGLQKLDEKKVDLFSLDLDGNDIYILEELLEKIQLPSIIIAEYNSKFFPPLSFRIKYNADHVWNVDDYFGASLTEFVRVLEKYSYKLVCCNSGTGANAFFVKNEYAERFKDIPNEIEKIYVKPRYELLSETGNGHKPSIKTIERIFERLEETR